MIEITLDIDSNGIIDVYVLYGGTHSAHLSIAGDSTKLNNSISLYTTAADEITEVPRHVLTITRTEDNLSEEEIQRMISEAENYKDDDDKQRERIAAKNSCESYAYNLKSVLEDEFKYEIFEQAASKCREVIDWLDKNQTAEKEEYEVQQENLEKVYMPTVQKLLQAGRLMHVQEGRPNINFV